MSLFCRFLIIEVAVCSVETSLGCLGVAQGGSRVCRTSAPPCGRPHATAAAHWLPCFTLLPAGHHRRRVSSHFSCGSWSHGAPLTAAGGRVGPSEPRPPPPATHPTCPVPCHALLCSSWTGCSWHCNMGKQAVSQMCRWGGAADGQEGSAVASGVGSRGGAPCVGDRRRKCMQVHMH